MTQDKLLLVEVMFQESIGRRSGRRYLPDSPMNFNELSDEDLLMPMGGGAGGAAAQISQELLCQIILKIICPKAKSPELTLPQKCFDYIEKISPYDSNQDLLDQLRDKNHRDHFLDNRIASINPDVIWAQYYIAMDLVLNSKEVRCPVMITGRTWELLTMQGKPNRSINKRRVEIEALSIKKSDRIIALAAGEAEAISLLYADYCGMSHHEILRKTRVMLQGVDHSLFNPEKMAHYRTLARTLFLPEHLQHEDVVVFAFIGRSNAEKRAEACVKAFCNYCRDSSAKVEVALLLFGGCRTQADQNRLDQLLGQQPDSIRSRIILHGPQPPLLAYAATDVLLVSSGTNEISSGVIREGAASKKCIVSTSNLSTLSIFPKESLYYIDLHCGDEEGLIIELQQAMTELSKSDDLRDLYAEKAYDISRQYTWQKTAKHLIEYIQELQ